MHWAHTGTPGSAGHLCVCKDIFAIDCTPSTVPHTASAQPCADYDTTPNNKAKPTSTAWT